MPAQWLQPNKASHRRREETVENPEVAVGVGLEHLVTIATELTIYHRNHHRLSADLSLSAQNVLVKLPVFSVFAEINNVGLNVALGRACRYYACEGGGGKSFRLITQ